MSDTEPSRRPWGRPLCLLLLLVVFIVALWSLDAWLKSWPIKVMAPCDAIVTSIHGPRQPGIDEALPFFQFSRLGMEAGRLLQERAGNIGSHRVLAEHRNVRLFFSPGLLAWCRMPEAYANAWLRGEMVQLPGGFTLGYDEGFFLSLDFVKDAAPSIKWLPLSPRSNVDNGRTSWMPDATGRVAIIEHSDQTLQQLRSLWVRVPDAIAEIAAPTTFVTPMPEDAVLQLDCGNAELGEALLETLQIAAPGVHKLSRLLRYPGLETLPEEATSITVRLTAGEDSVCNPEATVALAGVDSTRLESALDTSGLSQRSVPMEFINWSGMALPPSVFLAEPLLAWAKDYAVLATSPKAIGGMPDPTLGQPLEVVALLRISTSLHSHLESNETPPTSDTMQTDGSPDERSNMQSLPGRIVKVAEGSLSGAWVVFGDQAGSSSAIPAAYAPASPCSPDATEIDPDKPDKAVPWPHEIWRSVHTSLAAANLYEAMNTVHQANSAYSELPKGGEVGANFRPARWDCSNMPPVSASPLVTQTAWSILTTAELYNALDPTDAVLFREEQAEAVQEWSNFLVRWKRGPDAAPLSCIEESAGANDVYPLLVVYLGLRAGADWFYPVGAGMPEAWQLRLDDLRTELLASLLQPGQCLTCPALLMPIAESRGQLSPAALDALHRLPACPPPEREDYGVLPRCGN